MNIDLMFSGVSSFYLVVELKNLTLDYDNLEKEGFIFVSNEIEGEGDRLRSFSKRRKED